MSMEYRVQLPDHDWVVTAKNKLIPSVYAGIKIVDKYPIGQPEAVSYSGPTYVAVRSGKHCSSTAKTHGEDFERLLDLEGFQPILKTTSGEVKPVVVVTVDGGPDESPRNRSVIEEAVQKFKDHNLDFFVAVTNAPGRSAFNRAERRMAPLGKMMSGLILPHDHYGSHLDSQRRTIDSELELKNFEYAGEALASVWSSLVIDGESVTAEYIHPSETPKNYDECSSPGSAWYARHVRESQYLLQISKCLDTECCSKPRSKLRMILPDGFLPPPLLLAGGLEAAKQCAKDCHFSSLFVQLVANVEYPSHDYQELPYDFYCPSTYDHLKDRCCNICGLYFATQVAKKAHKRTAHNLATLMDIQSTTREIPLRRSSRVIARRGREILTEVQDQMGNPLDVEWAPVNAEDEEECDDPEDNIPLIHLIKDVGEWTASPWTLK